MRSARLLVNATTAATAATELVSGLVVLIYHRVGRKTAIEVDLPVDLFERQLRHLAERCRVVTLDEGLRLVASEQPGHETVVAVTFDDGTADFTDVASPIIDRYSIPVTVYAATAFLDEGVEFPDAGIPVSWAALRDAHSTGLVEIGSHTHRHALLDRLPATEVADELARSIDSIATNVGASPRHFAYPKAVRGSASAEQEVRARFRSAALAGTRPNRFGATDAHRLARSPIQVSDGMRWFTRKVHGGMAMEDSLRRGINRHRHRHLEH